MNTEEKLEAVNRDWSEAAENYARIVKDEEESFRVAAFQDLILRNTPQSENLTVLDTGCGPGFFTALLAQVGCNVVGIDGANGMLEKAAENLKAKGLSAQLMKMDCHHLEFADNTFDLAVSRNVTHALEDSAQVYREWLRVLKPGGVLLVFDANWHLPQIDGSFREEHQLDVKRCIETFGSDFNGNTSYEMYLKQSEGFRDSHPLGDLQRPDYDVGILKALGYREISYERDVTETIWDDKEKCIYRMTPMFLIRAVK